MAYLQASNLPRSKRENFGPRKTSVKLRFFAFKFGVKKLSEMGPQ